MDPEIKDIEAAKQYLAERTKPLPNGCLMWTGGRSKGYGQAYFEGHAWRAHRLAYIIHKGPTKLLVRHTCNFRPCCNEDHLIEGTASQNWDDALKAYRVRPILGRRFRKKPVVGLDTGVS